MALCNVDCNAIVVVTLLYGPFVLCHAPGFSLIVLCRHGCSYKGLDTQLPLPLGLESAASVRKCSWEQPCYSPLLPDSHNFKPLHSQSISLQVAVYFLSVPQPIQTLIYIYRCSCDVVLFDNIHSHLSQFASSVNSLPRPLSGIVLLFSNELELAIISVELPASTTCTRVLFAVPWKMKLTFRT